MIDIHDVVPADVLARAVARHGEVFVQGAWRRIVDGMPEGYQAVPYPKFQQHRLTGEMCTVATRAEHEALYAARCELGITAW